MFWSLELAIELKMSVLEQSGKLVLTLRRTFYDRFHSPPGSSTQFSPGPVISCFCCTVSAASKAGCVSRCGKLCLKSHVINWVPIRSPDLPKLGRGGCPKENMLLKTVFKMEKYCIFSKILFPHKNKYSWVLIASKLEDLCFQGSLEQWDLILQN